MDLPEQPPPLTPEAALALLRVLLKTRLARHRQTTDQPEAHHPDQSATNQERKG